jgi:hypothetical protein
VTSQLLAAPVVVMFGILAGCTATESQLRSRAAFDLQCDAKSIQIVKIDARTRGVRGCGQQATYVESCSGPNGSNCTWVLNNPPADNTPTPTPTAAANSAASADSADPPSSGGAEHETN